MDKEKMIKKVKTIGVILVIGIMFWVFLLSPFLKFKSNENKMLEASKRYFEVNRHELPTGKRVKTVTLKDLYNRGFLKEDLYVPLTTKTCSVSDSFAKVKHENGDYKYYVYLKCGVMSSIIDHEGPEIELNGADTVNVDKGSKYKELGVKSVRDNTDGTISTNSVKINADVNTKKIGTYKVTYTASDSFGNITEKVRNVKVVSRLKNIVKTDTNNTGYYQGKNPNNYIYFSGMLFRIVSIDRGNIKIIADEDISIINYNGIDKWLDYYYDHLAKDSKKYIVKNKYCNMKLNEETKSTTKCNSYTNKKKVYIISTDEINKSLVDDESFLQPSSVSWIANKYNNKEAYATRDVFIGPENGQNVAKFDSSFNYGIRPVITIKGDALVKSGNGSIKKPYNIGDFKSGNSNEKLNTRYSGEYVKYSGNLWRIIEVKDGFTKVVCEDTLASDGEIVETSYYGANIYNPNKSNNIGYFIDKKINKYIKTNYFTKRNIEVPIYKNKFAYQKENKTEKYKAKLFAPNMYEMFSAYSFSHNMTGSYWYINSSKEKGRYAAMSTFGVPINQTLDQYKSYGVRPAGYLDNSITITSGQGTKEDPYIIAK